MQSEIELTETELFELGTVVKSFTGMDFDKYKWLGFKISVKERMSACGLLHADAYLARLRANPGELDELVTLLSIPETYFFRDKKQFDVLREKILPEIVQRKRGQTLGKPVIRILSAGCSTGEETYSLAIAAHQSGLMNSCEFEVIGFDVSKNAIAKCRLAEYTRYSFREKDTDFLGDYFTIKGGKFILRDEIRKMVRFYQAGLFQLHNTEIALNKADIIFFRNVSIYFDQDGVLTALNILAQNLTSDGYLFLGPSESLFGKDTGFEMQRMDNAFVCRHKGKVEKSSLVVSLPTFKPRIMINELRNTKEERRPKNDVKRTTKPLENSKLSEDHYENAQGYWAIKDLDKAEQEFLKQLKVLPKHAKSLVGLAQIYVDTGRDELAIATCQKAIDCDKLLGDSYFILGLVHHKRGEQQEATACFKKAVYCEENHFLAQYYLGVIYQETGKNSNARKQFEVTMALIQAVGEEGLRREIAGLSGSYVMSLCHDAMSV